MKKQQEENYLMKIEALCKKNDIQLLFIKTPNIEWGRYEHDKMTAQAEALGIPFIDYNSFYKDLGITVEECFLDGAHLNYKGAEKLSQNLGETVVSLMEEMPEHSQGVYKEWDADLAVFRDLVREK